MKDWKICVMSPAPIKCTTGKITWHSTCNVHTAVCNETFYHKVKLISHIKIEHGVNVARNISNMNFSMRSQYPSAWHVHSDRNEKNSTLDMHLNPRKKKFTLNVTL